jgi:hypothetical protein
MTRRHLPLALAAGLVLAGACSGDDLQSPPESPAPPESPPPAPPAPTTSVDSVTITPNPLNALAVGVAVVAQVADSARVLFAAADGIVDSTPRVGLEGGRGTVHVLGLRSGAAYRGVVQVSGAAGQAQSDSVSFSGGELPEPLRGVSFATTGTGTAGLTLATLALAGSVFGMAFDSAGTIRWYRAFAFDGPQATGDLQQQPSGTFTLFIGATTGSQPVPGHYVEFAPWGDSLRTIAAPAPLYTDNHELLITGSGADERLHLFG